MIRDRIKSLRRVKAGSLKPSPRNWREHPEAQRSALQGVLDEVGYADALLARELPDGGLELVDGHLRADLDPDQKVPVLVLDVTEVEASKLLATIDPLAVMAEANEEALTALLTEIETDSAGLSWLLETLGQPKTEDEENRDAGLLTRDEIQAAEGEENQPGEMANIGETAKALLPAKCPIVPRYAEHYEAFIIVCENTVDEAWIRNRLGLEDKQKSHKGETIATANVITCEQLRGLFA